MQLWSLQNVFESNCLGRIFRRSSLSEGHQFSGTNAQFETMNVGGRHYRRRVMLWLRSESVSRASRALGRRRSQLDLSIRGQSRRLRRPVDVSFCRAAHHSIPIGAVET